MKTLAYLFFGSALVLFSNGLNDVCLFDQCNSSTGLYNTLCNTICIAQGWERGVCNVEGTNASCLCETDGRPDIIMATLGCPKVCEISCASCGYGYDSCTPSTNSAGVANGGYCNCTAPA